MREQRRLSRLKHYKLKVLIADDNIEARRGTRLMLSIHPGVEVTAIAQNGRHAVELAHTNPPDIVIMDINMPELDGLGAMQEMQEFLSDTLYIIITAERESNIIGKAIKAGANEYLVKPFTYDDLDKAIRACAKAWFARKTQSEEEVPTSDPDMVTLQRLAHVYATAHRTDEAALAVFERLVTDVNCELRWLLTLAMIYVIRQDWSRLKDLAERLERRNITDNP